MSKILYNDIWFDSQLEIDYYKFLKELKVDFIYHPKVPIKINSKNNYTPDFIVLYLDRIEIVETKGYNPYSKLRDDLIHSYMLEISKQELINYINSINININNREIVYKKYKYLKSYGWVDFDFKNPNTIANQRKEKIKVLEADKKASKNRLKDIDRYFGYLKKEKLTKPQKEWVNAFELENGLINLHRNYWRGI